VSRRPTDWSPLAGSDPVPGDPDEVERAAKSLADMVWVLPGVTGLVAVILCHRPAHRQVPWLTHSIFGCGWAAVVVGAIGGLLAGSSGFGPAWRVDGGKIVSLTV
jgi:hypothetical protein